MERKAGLSVYSAPLSERDAVRNDRAETALSTRQLHCRQFERSDFHLSSSTLSCQVDRGESVDGNKTPYVT